jgi:hypothetical protein
MGSSARVHHVLLLPSVIIPRYQVMQGICELAIEALVRVREKIQYRMLSIAYEE